MKFIKHINEEDYISKSFINWDLTNIYFRLVFYTLVNKWSRSYTIRIRWLKCDKPFRIFFNYDKWR